VPRTQVRPLTPATVADFWAVHREPDGSFGWCCCAAWWVPTWEGWGERTEAQNCAVREAVFAQGEMDGHVLTVDGAPAGWIQCGPRDRLRKLVEQYALAPDPDVWAVTCFALRAEFRGRGLAQTFLAGVLDDLRARGVRRVQGYPRPGGREEGHNVWTGPEAMFVRAGFRKVGEAARGPVYELDLGSAVSRGA
jgi:ribosomal protein S18 acetylase RimI-like enzyme